MGFWTRLRDLFRKETRVASGDPRRVLEVEKILAELRPALRADGGDLLLREVSASGEILLCAKGACEACGAHDQVRGSHRGTACIIEPGLEDGAGKPTGGLAVLQGRRAIAVERQWDALAQKEHGGAHVEGRDAPAEVSIPLGVAQVHRTSPHPDEAPVGRTGAD